MSGPSWKDRPDPESGTWILAFNDYESGWQFITIWPGMARGTLVPTRLGSMLLSDVIEYAGSMQRWFGPIPEDPEVNPSEEVKS